MPYFPNKQDYYDYLDSQVYEPQKISISKLDYILKEMTFPRKGLFYAELPKGCGWEVLDTTKRIPGWAKSRPSWDRYSRKVYTAVRETEGDAIAWLMNRHEKTRSGNFAAARKELIKYAMDYFEGEFEEDILLDYFYRHCLIENCTCDYFPSWKDINFRLDRVRRRLYGIMF